MSLIKVDIPAKTAAADANEIRVVRMGSGRYAVEPNVSRFGENGKENLERLAKERKVFFTKEEALKYAKGTGKSFSVLDEAADDAGNFKVGDKVRVAKYTDLPVDRKTTYKVVEVRADGNVGIREAGASQGQYVVKPDILAAADGAAQDAADDGIAAIERGVRGFLEDAKKAKSVYEDILKRSAIANKNESVRQNFVSYIARCDKVIRALESIR